MSSVNPVFLLPGALAERADTIAAAYVTSVTGSAGQLCTQPGLVFALESPETDRFLDASAAALTDVVATPMLTSRMAEAYAPGRSRWRRRPACRRPPPAPKPIT